MFFQQNSLDNEIIRNENQIGHTHEFSFSYEMFSYSSSRVIHQSETLYTRVFDTRLHDTH